MEGICNIVLRVLHHPFVQLQTQTLSTEIEVSFEWKLNFSINKAKVLMDTSEGMKREVYYVELPFDWMSKFANGTTLRESAFQVLPQIPSNIVDIL